MYKENKVNDFCKDKTPRWLLHKKKIEGGLAFLWIPIFCMTFLFFTGSAWGQRLQRFGLEEGLPQSSVNCITQDKKGFLWVGTQDGLARFDGRDFRVFGKEEGISTTFIRSILEDQNQNLWVGTTDGLFMLKPNRLEIIVFKNHDTNPSSISSNFIHCLFQDSTGTVWVGTRGGLASYDKVAKKFVHHENSNVLSVAKGRANTLWLGTTNGLLLFDIGLNKVSRAYRYSPADPNHTLKNNIVVSILPAGKRLYLGTQGGFCWLDLETQRFNIPDTRLNSEPTAVIPMQRLSNGSLLIGMQGGVLIGFEEHANKVTPFKAEAIITNRINALYNDNQHGLWIGTEVGLYLYHPLNQFLHTVKGVDKSNSRILVPSVNSLASNANGQVWIGYDNDVVARFNEKNRQLELVPALSKKYANFLYVDKDDLWIGFSGISISQLNLKSGTYHENNFPRFDSNLMPPNTQIVAMEEKSNDELWVALVPVGLINYNKRTHQCSAISNASLGVKTKYLPIITLLKIDDWLWLGTFSQGLIAWNEKADSVVHYNELSGLSGNMINHLLVDKQGQLWVGSNGGLSRFDANTGRFQSFTQKDGLPNNTVYSMAEDNGGNLWLATNKGLARFTPPNGKRQAQVMNFDEKDGLPSREFNQGAVAIGATGNFYFGGTNGVVFFNPDSLSYNDFEPPIVITDFQVFGKDAPLLYSDTLITLPHNQNFFSFTFAALSFYRSDKNQYAFQLEGLDKEWVYTGTENKANYTFVPPGTYTFRVKAANNTGLWNSETLAIRVVVLPPWWRTWWAYTMYAALFVFAVLLVIERRTRKLTKQNLLLEEKVAERTDQLEETNQELISTMENLKETQQQLIESEKMASLGLLTAGIAHEINNPLNFISSGAQGLKEVFAENKELAQADQAVKNEVALLLQIVDRGVERAAKIVKSLRLFSSPQLPAQEITETNIEECMESSLTLVGAKLTEHSIHVVKKYHTTSPVKCNYVQLSQVFVNLLDNAVYACSKVERLRTITITIMQGQNNVLVSVADNGMGIPAYQQREIFNPFFTTKEVGVGTGLGLYISYGIIKNHHGQITFSSTEGEGTEFRVVLYHADTE
jgi:signal transduction histidine kinase/ligand-binding sensor domain-containing protein